MRRRPKVQVIKYAGWCLLGTLSGGFRDGSFGSGQ
jgi:hypothetical protein